MRFFEHHLKEAADPELPEALVFESGANRWQGFEAWPPADLRQRAFLLVGAVAGDPAGLDAQLDAAERTVFASEFEVAELRRLVDAAGAEVVGIHAHSGSGILDPHNWRSVAGELVQIAEQFPGVEVIDIGG